MPSAVDGESVPFGQRFDRAIDGSQEVVAVRLRVEADEVGANQAVHQLALPRADAEDLGVRPRNVPEDRHARVRTRLFDETRQEREVVVVHQQDRRTHVPHFFEHRIRELTIDRLIVRPVLGPEDRARVGDVAERPEALVREAVVVAALFLPGQPDAAQRVAGMIRRHTQPARLIHDDAIGAAGALRDPCPAAREHDGLDRGDQPARRHDDLDAAIAEPVHVRFAVRHDEERLIREPVPDADAEPLGGPDRRVRFAQPGLALRRRARGAQVACEMRDLVLQLVEETRPSGSPCPEAQARRCAACAARPPSASADR